MRKRIITTSDAIVVALARAWRFNSAYAVFYRYGRNVEEVFLGVLFDRKVADVLEDNGYIVKLIQEEK